MLLSLDYGLGARRKTFEPLLGDGIFTQQGESWAHSRKLLIPLFKSNRATNFDQIIRPHAQILLDGIVPDQVVDLQKLFFRFTLDTTLSLLFGHSVKRLEKPNYAAFETSFRVGQDYLASRGRLGDLCWLIGGREFRDACKTVHQFIDECVSEAVESWKHSRSDKSGTIGEKEEYVFTERLLEETRDPKVLRDQLANVLLAGRDTTACCLSWTFRLLARHPEVFEKLRQEILSIVGLESEGKEVDVHSIKRMRYLSLVLKEVLRLYPSVPINSRAALCDTILPVGGGPDKTSPVFVRKGEAVGYCPYVMHRRKDLYGEDAEEFRPERWDSNEPNKVDLKKIGWGYVPFNGGPRVCVGQDFALLEASYAIVRIVQRFSSVKFGPEDKGEKIGDERQEVTLVLACTDGCNVILQV